MIIYWILIYILVGLFWSWLADHFMLANGEDRMGFAATFTFIFAWPIAIALVIYFMFQYAKGKK